MSTRQQKLEEIESDFGLFEWDDLKRDQNFEKHQLDFEDAIGIFSRPILRRRSDRRGETRYLAIGVVEDVEIAVIYTERDGICRVISARRARKNERKAYHKAFPDGP